MALLFLPEAEIQPMFERLQREATEQLLLFTQYVSSTWIHGTTWSPVDWTVFRHAICTNSDIEGWHHGLNRRASKRPAADVPSYQGPSQRGYADSHSDLPGV